MSFIARIVLALSIPPLATTALYSGPYNMVELVEAPRFAGLYPQALPFPQYRDLISSLVSLNRPTSPMAERYGQKVSQMLNRQHAAELGPEEQASLGAYLLRLRRYDEAVELLTAALRKNPQNFLLRANLAAAYEFQGRFDRALPYLQETLEAWPREWPGLTKDQLAWYKEAERYHHRLLRSRYRESLQAATRGRQSVPQLDPIFDTEDGHVRFVGPSGAYEAGELALIDKQKLPKHALAIAQQLSLWLPDDSRLYWLVGELYNAEGNIDAARRIMEECLWSRRLDSPELRRHRLVLQEATPKKERNDFESLGQGESDPSDSTSTGRVKEDSDLGKEPISWMPGTSKIVAVTGVTSACVIILAYLQLREIKRKRKIRRMQF
jgi:tetratricopeptide (TPR) repeat protein